MNRSKPRARDNRIAASLCAWFESNARDLPWRRRRTGYTALVSEAMLQQTQVARVIDAYRAFMRRFPTVRRLAAASEQDVLARWQGLGYYRRALNLRAAAMMIVREFNGRVPRDVESLQRLPGVGRYTAGAIASIAYGQHAPILDGNVRRVLMRLDARDDFESEREESSWCWQRADELVNASDRPGILNEAMMELGALVCTPGSPHCAGCPAAKHCRARRRGIAHMIPVSRREPTRRRVHHHAIIIRRGGRILIEQRPRDGMWSSMWQVPTIEHSRKLTLNQIETKINLPLRAIAYERSFDFNTTHRAITMHVYEARTLTRRGDWRRPDDLDSLPLSNLQRRVLLTCAT